MIKRTKKGLSLLIAATIAVSNLMLPREIYATVISNTDSNAPIVNEGYEIYPVPQSSTYENTSFSVGDSVNVVFESGVDIYTQNRLKEVLNLHNINFNISDEIVGGATNILIGINESNEVVDNYFNTQVPHEEQFFEEKTDAHIVSSNDNVIGVLGEDADSAFYGVTTLKHVFNQLENNEIKEFRIDDYSDVAYRGFIEGYYGNPWSNDDRADLMTYGGDYKLNQYIFAPKDDPYHNSKWRELYPEEALQGIKKLAAAGEASKTRYVYALHPFMHNAIKFDTEENYQNDLNIIKEKFTQLLEAGVRQFGILADDAGVPAQGPTTYVKLLNDLTVWLREQQETYPDLKDDIIFCPNDYMGWGGSEQLKEVNKAGDNVSIVMTGGKIWGEVSQNFATSFKNNIASEGHEGRAPYFWINWPCSDNSKKHLIMGGNDTFLHPGVQPESVKGIVLNPMQQAEANKSALFAVADYAWNIWSDKAGADQNWQDSFKYMDHGTAEETASSTALRELSKHMINQNMDGRVTALQESVELAPKLNAFKEKYATGASIKEDAEALIAEFTKLKEYAAYYKENPGNTRTRDQIIYWLNCWEDTTTAAIGYLKAAIAAEEGDNNETWAQYSEAQAAFEKSKTYGFHYVDHTEYAEVGVQHIVPFIKFMGQNLSSVVGSIVDPSKVISTFITNRTDAPEGSTDNLFDNNPQTEIVYKNPNSVAAGTYVGVKYNKLIKLKDVEIVMGAKANANDTMQEAKVQYTVDGNNWVDINEEVYSMPQKIVIEGLDLEVKGIRVIATKDRSNTWLGIKDITVNKGDMESAGGDTEINASLIRTPGWGVYSGNESNLTDGNDNTSVWYRTHTGDMTRVGDYIGLDLGKVIPVGKVHLAVGADNGDKWTKYKLEYSSDNERWTTFKEYDGKSSGKDIIDEDFQGIEARYVRITNMKEEHKWVKFSELKVEPCVSLPSTKNVYTNTEVGIKSIYLNDSLTKLSPQENITLTEGQYIGIKLDRIKDLSEIALEISDSDGLTLQTSANGVEWTNVSNESELEDARYIRLIANRSVTFNLAKFEVKSNEIYSPSLVSAYAGFNADPSVAFDGNFNSRVKYTAVPRTGNTIVYDLGQVRDINNLKYVVLDTEKDHIRDGKIQVSLDGENWTDVISIENNIPNTSADMDSKPTDNGYTHGSLSGGIIPISHAYMDSGKINEEARYLRVVFTAPYGYRWTVINEFLINNGEYIPTVNDPTFISNPIEVQGHGPSNVLDGDLTTAYKPNTNNGEITSGSFIYRLSEKTDVKKINIIQSGNEISNAKVMARVGKDEEGNDIWQQLGVLDKSLNEIVNTKYDNIFELKIEWNGVAPSIYEIITINDYEVPNVSDLEALINSCNYVEENYAVNSWIVYNKALEAAKKVLNNIGSATQESINSARKSLVEAITGLVDISELRNVISRANEIINDDKEYTEETISILEATLSKANNVISNSAATTEEVSATIEELEAAIDGLVEKEEIGAVIKIHLEIAVEEAESITDEMLENVVPAVVKEFKAALEEAKSLLVSDKATQAQINASFDRLSDAMQMLSFEKGDKEALVSLIDRINGLKGDEYIADTWTRLQTALEASNKVASDENAMEEEVQESYKTLLKAFLELRLKPNKDKLEDLINKVKNLDSSNYTAKSWRTVEKSVEKANKVMNDKNATEKEIKKAEENLQKAINNLESSVLDEDNSNNVNNNIASSNDGNNASLKKDSNKNTIANNTSASVSKNSLSKTSTSSLPKTGGTSAAVVGFFGALMSTLGLSFFKKKK